MEGLRSLGVEEELLLVDPGSGERRNVSLPVLREAADGEAPVDHELLQHMIEIRSRPTDDLASAVRDLAAGRRAAIAAAARVEMAVVAVGLAPLGGAEHRVTPDTRYARIVQEFGRLGRDAGTLAMHVHVAVESDAEGVRVLDGLRPWLPVLVALSANSPFADGQDTGYASWRQQVWSRWPTAGPTEPFGSLEEYRRATTALVGTGAALDPGMLYFEARLSPANPTVEIRVADVCTDLDDTALVAALCRALVTTVADHEPGPRWRADLLRAAHWRAARHGLADELVHPLEGTPAPASDVVALLVDTVRPALAASHDEDLVTAGLERLGARGGGATRQRQVFERTRDVREVVLDLVDRTRATAED